ncbi:MAG: FAD-dependent oxidoreductase [Thermoplasmatota archaeon]
MISISIDGKSMNAKQGQTVLEAAIENGIYIPNLCFHPNLRPIGSCRLCIVSIENVRGYPISCHTKVSDGMVVQTNTEKLQRLRRNLLWLILSNYPKEIPLGSQLRQVVEYVGVNDLLSNYVPLSKDLPIFSEDPLFVRDMNKCILCGRCVQMCQEVRGVGAIGLVNRGIDTIVGTSFDDAMKDAGCKFCRACVEVCPSGALIDKQGYGEAERKKVLIPCAANCPAGTDIPRYVRLIAEGRYQDSIEVIREKFPFPHVLGLVCNHPCETKCSRGDVNEPISVRELKRFVAEKDTRRWKKKVAVAKDTGKKIAIVGSGPAGLTAAWFLRKKGHNVTVFEMLSKPGGMLKAGIPDYRLPPEVLEKEIRDITDIGVKIKTSTEVVSTKDLFRTGFDVVFLAMGAPKGYMLGIPGEDDPRVLDGILALRNINFGQPSDIVGDIAVVGGGNVAIDVARCALRIGARSVTLLYRRTRQEMPAYQNEIEDALDEGVEIKYLVNPVRIIKGKEKLEVECVRMELGEPDKSGRRRPVPIKGSEFILSLDRLVLAIGQQIEVPKDIAVEVNKKSMVVVDEHSLMTSENGVFAGGDMVSGPASVIEAIQMGRVAASSIDTFLGGNGEIEQKYIEDEVENPFIGRNEGFADRKRVENVKLASTQRIPGFPLVEACLTEKDAVSEAERCLRCQLRLCIDQPPCPPEKGKKATTKE